MLVLDHLLIKTSHPAGDGLLLGHSLHIEWVVWEFSTPHQHMVQGPPRLG